MRVLLAAIVSIAWSAGTASADERLDGLFASWQQAEREMRSLVVEMEVRSEDPHTRTTEKWSAVLKLIRTPKGDLSGSYDQVELKPHLPTRRSGSALLCAGVPYWLTHEIQYAFRYDAKDDPLGFLQYFFNPIVLLVDRKRAEAEYQLDLTKRDEWYTYLTVQPKDKFLSIGQVAVMNKATDAIPKDMPCVIRLASWHEMRTFEIKSWRLNPPDAPKLQEFVPPENRAGWRVHGWDPFPTKR